MKELRHSEKSLTLKTFKKALSPSSENSKKRHRSSSTARNNHFVHQKIYSSNTLSSNVNSITQDAHDKLEFYEEAYEFYHEKYSDPDEFEQEFSHIDLDQHEDIEEIIKKMEEMEEPAEIEAPEDPISEITTENNPSNSVLWRRR